MLPKAFHTSQRRASYHDDPEKSSDPAILRTEQVSGQLKPNKHGILTLFEAHFNHCYT
jgi:hypothetical protein